LTLVQCSIDSDTYSKCMRHAWLLLVFVCVEFQKRVLFQLAKLSKEVSDVRRLLERQMTASRYAEDNVLDIEVARGPLQSVAAVRDLDNRCSDANVRQFLVCTRTICFADRRFFACLPACLRMLTVCYILKC